MKTVPKDDRIRVLHVDDDSFNTDFSKQILMDIGSFDVDHACCVEDAFKKLAMGHYDVVVSDYEMPQKDGLQFLKELREQKDEIPFILFTGKGREEVAIKALNLGADGYINKQGAPEIIYGELSHTIRQVVEHNKTKRELQERDIRLAKLASQIPGVLYQLMRRPDGTYCVPYASAAIRDIFGCSPEDVREDFSPIVRVVVSEDLDSVTRSIDHSAMHMTLWQCMFRVQLPGQQIRWIGGQAAPERLDDGSVIWNGYSTDISELKKIEEELKITANIFDLDTDLIFVHDTEGDIVNFNEAAYKLGGYTMDEMAKMNIRDINAPNSAALFESMVKLLLETGSAVFDSVYIRKDKTLLPTEIHAHTFDSEGKKLILSVARDTTERKKAEEKLNRMMDQLVLVNEKLGVVGEMTRHDVHNKLSMVTGYSYLIKKKHADQADILEGLGKMEQAVKEISNIFDFAKIYEQIGVEELTYIDVEETLNDAVALFSGPIPRVINECHGLMVLSDSFLRQMFFNLIEDTRKYGGKTTTIRVYFEKAESGELRLIYTDDGVGISAENKPRLFTEGYSTGGSTGFGLFLIKKMIEIYGWGIQETGEPEKGAKFTITIPKINKNGKEGYKIE